MSKFAWKRGDIEVVKSKSNTLFLDSVHTYKLVHRDDEWCVTSEDGTKSLGCYPTETEARERLRQVEAAKAAKRK